MKTLDANSVFTALYPEAIVRAIATLTDEFQPGRKFRGGVLTVSFPCSEGASHEAHTLGDPGVLVADFAFFSVEKIRRLMDRRQKEGREEFASSQSADKDKEQYGGCILAHTENGAEVYLSFSGAPDVVDEAVVYVIAEKRGLVMPPDYRNPLLERARGLIQRHVL